MLCVWSEGNRDLTFLSTLIIQVKNYSLFSQQRFYDEVKIMQFQYSCWKEMLHVLDFIVLKCKYKRLEWGAPMV